MKGIKRKTLGILTVAFLAAGLMVSCESEKSGKGESQSAEVDASGFPRAKSLYLAGSQWGDPNTFNPLSDWPAWPINGTFNLMYEPLLAYNSLTGKVEPLLATLASQNNDEISVIMNSEAKWSDGKALTSADVKFTYELGKNYKGAPTTYIWDFIKDIKVEKVEADTAAKLPAGEKLTFMVNKEGRNNPLVVMDLLQAIRIVPAHTFTELLKQNKDDLSAVQKLKIDQNPVVSGPYNLETYSNEKIVLKRRNDYWGNKALYAGKMPKPEYIIHPIYKSNDHFSIALQKGNLDGSQTFIPRIWMKKKHGVNTWYDKEPYFVPGAIPMLLINCTKAPLNDKNFRRAMAHAIDYKSVKELAVSGYSPDLKPGLIMPFGIEGKFYDEAEASKNGAGYSVEKAKKLLADAGYKSVFGSDGSLDHMTDKDGNKVPTVYIKSPAGWSDWEAMVKIAVKGMRAAGIDAREGFVDAGLYWQSQPTGDFDLIMHKPAASVTPSQPWARFEAVMSSRNWKAVGEKMNENQGRYNQPGSKTYNPAVDSLLKAIPTISDETELKAAYVALNNIFMQDQPALPLAFLPEQFYEFSDQNWKNWPTEKNPYAPPSLPWSGAATKILWDLQPAK